MQEHVRHRQVGDIRRPHLIGPLDGRKARQHVRMDRGFSRQNAGGGPVVGRLDANRAHMAPAQRVALSCSANASLREP